MHKKFFSVAPVLLVLTFASGAGAATTSWLTSLDEALAQAARHDRYVLVDLYAEWCGWCKVLEKEVFSTPEFRDFTRDFVLLRVDVDDGAEGSALQARFSAYSLPTTLIMDKNQVRVGTVTGFAPAPAFLQKLAAEVASYRAFLDYYEKVRQSADLGALYQLAEELHSRSDGGRAVGVYQEILRRTGASSPKAVWLHYLIADAYRLAGRFDDALETLARARGLAGQAKGRDLLERLDLLGFYIAQDSQNCEKAKSSLRHFLETHPRSAHRRDAQRALDDLLKGQGRGCA